MTGTWRDAIGAVPWKPGDPTAAEEIRAVRDQTQGASRMKMKLYIADILIENNGKKTSITAKYFESKTVNGIEYSRSDPNAKFKRVRKAQVTLR